MAMKNLQSLSVCLCMYIHNKRWMNYFVSNLQGAVKKKLFSCKWLFFSFLTELRSVIMLHSKQTLLVIYLLYLLSLRNKIFFTSMWKPTAGTTKGTTMTQVAQMFTGQPVWATPSEICHLNMHSDSHLLSRELCNWSWLKVCWIHEQNRGPGMQGWVKALEQQVGHPWQLPRCGVWEPWPLLLGAVTPLLSHISLSFSDTNQPFLPD